MGFYVTFDTVQVISQWIAGRAEETITCSWSRFCTVNCQPMANNYQLSNLRPGLEPNPASEVGGKSVTTLPPWPLDFNRSDDVVNTVCKDKGIEDGAKVLQNTYKVYHTRCFYNSICDKVKALLARKFYAKSNKTHSKSVRYVISQNKMVQVNSAFADKHCKQVLIRSC